MSNKGKYLLSAAVAALAFGGSLTLANAADLKGGQYGDLEERVAELEATTARKGNRVVSLQVYGQINKALLIWDDGVDSDAFIVDPDSDGSRLGFTGKAQIKPGWTAGYTMEFNVTDNASNQVSQEADDINALDTLRIRRNFLYVEGDKLGRFSIGQENQATDGINEIDVVGTYSTVSKSHYAGGFFLRDSAGGTTGVTWGDVLGAIGGSQEDIIRYDTPSIYGFILSASWGDDNIWDVALRFQKEFNSVKIAAGIGYLKDDRDDSDTDDQLSGSISVQHVPTGLFATFAAGSRSFRDETAEEATNIYVKGGISRKWSSLGATTLFVDYANFKNFSDQQEFQINGALQTLTSSEANVLGVGIVQEIDAAAMNIFANAQFFEADLEANGAAADTEDHFAIVIGSHIKF